MSESSPAPNSSQSPREVFHSANADAIERQRLYEREATIHQLLGDSSLTEHLSALTDPSGLGEVTPQPEDLVVLVQALNQCNSNLLVRVAELEAALAKSQADLKVQAAQAPKGEEPSLKAELNLVKQKVMKLRQQMNMAHQANQAQRSRIQDLQQQLVDAEQKYSSLAESHTQLQEQFQTQSQRLGEAENTCRDLCLRLHRQQQYTLQFKAALKAQSRSASTARDFREPAAMSALDGESASTVREIRPWSASPSTASQAEALVPPAPLSNPEPDTVDIADLSSVDPVEPAEAVEAAHDLSPFMEIAILPNSDFSDDIAIVEGDRPESEASPDNVTPLHLPNFPSVQQLASLDEEHPKSTDGQGAEGDAMATTGPSSMSEAVPANASRPLTPISFDMKQSLPKWAKFTHTPMSPEDIEGNPTQGGEPSAGIPVSYVAIEEIASVTAEGNQRSLEMTREDVPNPQEQDVVKVEASPVNFEREAPTPDINLDPALLEQLDAAVQPLLDSVVDAIRGGDRPYPVEPAASVEESVAERSVESTASEPSEPSSVTDVLREPDLHRAEEDLWRDLAKLVNISTDDIIQASLSGDFDAFKSIDFDALRRSAQGEKALDDHGFSIESEFANSGRPVHSSHAARPIQDGLDLPFSKRESEEAIAENAVNASALNAEVGERSPSPVVYPERTTRKLNSIAAIDLPSFPRPQPS